VNSIHEQSNPISIKKEGGKLNPRICLIREGKLIGKIVVLAGLFLLISAQPIWAGTAGKIAGVVNDAESRAPLPGAAVMIQGTSIGTSTDEDGEYFILNVPVGTYTVEASLIGYQKVIQTKVTVLLDLTTPLDFQLVSSPIELKKGVTVVASRPLIQKDLTSSTDMVIREQLNYLPNAVGVQPVISNMAGTVVDDQGLLHVRGGRDATVSYFLDDIYIQDPLVGQPGTRIPPEALEELNLTTGGFTAEYGEALSGVVTAITREGGSAFSGKIKAYDGLIHPYQARAGEYARLRRNKNHSLVVNLGGPLTFRKNDKATFFVLAEKIWNDGYLPHNEREITTGTGKISLRPVNQFKLILTGNYYARELLRYQHRDVNGISYDFNLDGLGKIQNKSYSFGAKTSYATSKSTFLSVKLSHFYTDIKLAPEHLFDVYWDQWPGYAEDSSGVYVGTIDDENYNVAEEYFYTGYTSAPDYYPRYHYRRAKYTSLGFDLVSQVDKRNQIKLGGVYRANRLKWDDKQFFNVRPYGEKYEVDPNYAAVYVQDKLELKEIIVNAGLRLDYLDADIDYWNDPVAKEKKVHTKAKTQLSPRLGISHPISERTVIHFSYGYYFQVPPFQHMFTNLQADLTTGLPVVGNPNMEAEKSIAYELGVNHALTDDITMKATTYYKDLHNLSSTREVVYSGGAYTQFVNADYGTVKGLDLIITKRPDQGNLSGTINYSYMIAKGNASDAYEGYYDYFTQGTNAPVWPVREYPLAFDQRHTLTVDLDYRVPRDWRGNFAGLSLPGAWGLNVLTKYGSGMPYTKTDDQGNRLGALNEGRMPATYRVDLKFNKDFYLFPEKQVYLSFFTEVVNLFDRRNVLRVYSNTGKPDDDGYHYELTLDPDGDGPLTAEDVNRYYRLLAKDPQNYDAPRTVRWGIEFVF
jgi:outer membrane receptor protein involved in Fe transport